MKAIQEIPMNNLFRFRSTLNNYYRIFRIPQGLKHQSLLSTDAAKLDLPTIRNAEGKRITSNEYLLSLKNKLGIKDADSNFVPDQKALNVIFKEYDLLVEENGNLLDKYLRALAEVENTRRRSNKQVEEAKIFAVQNFSKDLLEVADVLDIALKSINEKGTKNDSLKEICEGITLIRDVLLKIFHRHGLVPIHPIGQKFDPNIHEAVLEIPESKESHKPGHIADVTNIGYSLHDRPIRPAKVVVVKER